MTQNTQYKDASYIGNKGKEIAYLRANEHEAEKFVSHIKKITGVAITWRKDMELIIIVNPSSEKNEDVVEAIYQNRDCNELGGGTIIFK